ncbi:MAG: ATP-binding protein, partial [Syntrophales bacterium]|nr:ATP-binding protein [Syntrophales bacterium]
LARAVFAEQAAAAAKVPKFMINPLPPARGDLVMLRQVWANLLANACKFSQPQEQPAIEVGGHRNGKENVYYVRDNGVGFDMQDAGKVFESFTRLHRTEEFAGTGIGLALVSRIIERHGGRVWAEGKPEEGATFYFSLPRIDSF